MENRLLGIASLVLIVVYSLGMLAILLDFELAFLPYRWLGFVAQLGCAGGLRLLWLTGSYRDSPLWKFQGIAIALLLSAMLFRLMHWPWGNEAMMLAVVSIMSMMVNYAIHFVRKPRKGLRDVLRLLVVVLGCCLFGLVFLHVVEAGIAWWATSGVIGLAVLEYLLHSSDKPPGTPADAPPKQDGPSDADLERQYPELFG